MKIILALIHTGRPNGAPIDPRFYDEITQTGGGGTLAQLHGEGLRYAQSKAEWPDDVILMLDNDETIAGDPEAFRAECRNHPIGLACYVERQDRECSAIKVFAGDALPVFDAIGYTGTTAAEPIRSVRFTEAPPSRERADYEVHSLSLNGAPCWRRSHYLAEAHARDDKRTATYYFGEALEWAITEGEARGAWSAFRLAQLQKGAPVMQARTARRGLALDPTSCELTALLASAAIERKQYDEALALACQAIALGHVEGLRRPGNGFPSRPETFCKSWSERFDAPYLAAHVASKMLGREQDARDYEQKTQVARRLRLRHTLYLQTPPLGMGDPAYSPEAAQAIADTDPPPFACEDCGDGSAGPCEAHTPPEPKPHWIEEP